MSRIFDALQRSELEGNGFEFPLASSLADKGPPAAVVETNGFATSDIAQFQSLAMSVSPNSRLVCLTDEASLGAEKFRFLAVRLRQLLQARSLKKVLITSTIPEEGKSMVSANLAIALAQRRQQKILLVEGDLRRPSLSTRATSWSCSSVSNMPLTSIGMRDDCSVQARHTPSSASKSPAKLPLSTVEMYFGSRARRSCVSYQL